MRLEKRIARDSHRIALKQRDPTRRMCGFFFLTFADGGFPFLFLLYLLEFRLFGRVARVPFFLFLLCLRALFSFVFLARFR